MYIIIVGAGDIGTPLIDIATRSGNEVVVIERDEAKADRVASEHDCLVLNADATVKETLVDAGADQADALISTTDQDATNIMVCLLSQELKIPGVVSVVHNPEHMGLFRQIGVNTMENPQQLIAEYLYRAVARPAIVDYMRIGEEAEVFEITVTEEAPVAGKTLIEAAESGLIDDDTLVVAIGREGTESPITPRGQTEIRAGDLLTVYSARGADPELTDIFGHYEDHTEEGGGPFGLSD
ncbi:potassium channel family protein [Halomarina litorea]|uniref:potassium channel family protein n=1 Tax=Halomarina litorea TaxID=2961595 RepID=UPI0020C39A53|nr:TrkA family potassium uptake protein [Halomarina sp. BCD28]